MSDGNAPAAARPDYEAVIAAAITTLAASAAKPAAPAPAEQQAAAAAPAAPAAVDPRDRIKAIIGCEAAKDRQGLAHHLALETDLSAEQAEAILKASSAEAAAAAPGNSRQDALATAMAKAGNSAGVKPDAAGITAQRPSLADRVAAKFQKKGA